MAAAFARLIMLVGPYPFGWILYALSALAHQKAVPTSCGGAGQASLASSLRTLPSDKNPFSFQSYMACGQQVGVGQRARSMSHDESNASTVTGRAWIYAMTWAPRAAARSLTWPLM